MSNGKSPDVRTLLGKFTMSKRGRTRPISYKKPRDRLIESLSKQSAIINLLKEGRDPKQEGYKEHKMFYEDKGNYVVQLRYSNTPIELTNDSDAVEVKTLEEVEEVINAFMILARNGYFDEQINRLAGEWAAKRIGPRGPRKPKAAPTEQTA